MNYIITLNKNKQLNTHPKQHIDNFVKLCINEGRNQRYFEN